MDSKELLHGAIGLTKATIGIEKASTEIIKLRKKICRDCPNIYEEYSRLIGKNVSRCKICKCFINSKVSIKSEQCDDIPRRWEKEI